MPTSATGASVGQREQIADSERVDEAEPGDRAPAPGPLALVQAFVNTVDLEDGSEEFADAASLLSWLDRRGLIGSDAQADEDDLSRAIEVREAIRSLLVANADGQIDPEALGVLNRAAEAAELRVVFEDNRNASLQPKAEGVDGALGRLLAIVIAAMADGSWARLKACRYDRCRWAFYDASKNRSGAWCSMSVCGNKVKTRSYRARRRR